jgi:RHS repeat-associated protein
MTYDSENRVKKIETRSDFLGTLPGVRLEFTYDFLGRRARKAISNYSNLNWVPVSTSIYVYDGWNLIAEYKQDGGALTLDKAYYWGLDLSGSLQGAGGIGGLLGMISYLTVPGRYCAFHDAQGSVVGMVSVESGRVAAEYEYGPFGEVLRGSGPLAAVNPWQYSSKYLDAETGLLNFGYRYYSSSLGRFLNRDPKDEPVNGSVPQKRRFSASRRGTHWRQLHSRISGNILKRVLDIPAPIFHRVFVDRRGGAAVD